MHANTYIYFLIFLCCMKIQYDFFLETWPHAWKIKHFIFLFLFFLMFWRKPGILISDLYLYSIKIQTNIDQNTVKYLWKIIDFWRIFFFRVGPNPAHVAGLDLASPAWSLAQASDPIRPCTCKILCVHEQCEGK